MNQKKDDKHIGWGWTIVIILILWMFALGLVSVIYTYFDIKPTQL